MWLLNVTPLVVIEGLDSLICRVEAYFFILFFFKSEVYDYVIWRNAKGSEKAKSTTNFPFACI